MERVLALGQDMALLWIRYAPLYLSGVVNTLLLAVAATVLGCLIGLACGLLNTIPIHPQDRLPRRVLLRLLRAVIRIYVEVFRGTPMVLQAVFLYYGLPYFTNNAMRFDNVWAAALLVVSINTGAYMAGVNGEDAAANRLGHVGAGVDGHHQNGGHPDAVKPHGVVRKIGQAVIEEHRLQHHGGTPEDLHVDPDHCPDQRQKEPLDGRVVLAVGNGVQNAADESDQAADGGGHQCQNQGIADAGQIVGHAVVRPELGNVGCQLEQFLHGGRLPSVKS